ncbi:MAG: acyltransferase family protein [Acidimicrobiia bacterium]|nr:acyltransferase family protein [Acidimicrobiia bacterium]
MSLRTKTREEMVVDLRDGDASRLHYIDHLRAALVTLVVVHHVALVYGAGAPFYYVEPPFTDAIGFRWLLVFVLANQAWFMGAFFLLAGYFTPGAFDRKGSGAFLRDRIIRLGVPLAVYVFLLNPLAELGAWLMPAELTGITRDPVWSDYPDLIGLGPLWFVAMLLVFSFGYVGYKSLAGGSGRSPARMPGYAALAAFTVALAAVSYGWRMIVPLGESVWQFPTLAYLPQYLSFFALGALAYRRDWLATLTGVKGVLGALFAGAAAVLLFPLAFSGEMFTVEVTEALENAMGDGHWQSAVYAAWDSIFAVGLVLALVVAFRAAASRRNAVGSFLANHSYAVYVLHIPVVVYGAYLLRSLEMTAIAKTALVSAVVVPACFAIAFIVRKLPGVSRVL